MARPNRKRLSMDMPIDLHAQLIKMAHKYNITLTVYILRTLKEQLKKDKYYDDGISDMLQM